MIDALFAGEVIVPTIEIVARIAAGVALLLGNAFFVMTEFALTRLRQYERDDLPDAAGVARGWKMTEELELHLTGCQVGITLTSILLGVVAEPGVTALFLPLFEALGVAGSAHAISIVVSIFVINLAHTVWGEQAPTYLGVERPLQVLRFGAVALYWWSKLIYPLLLVGDWLAKATLRVFGIRMTRSWLEAEEAAAAEGEPEKPLSYGALRRRMRELLSTGRISKDRRDEVLAALEIGDMAVSEIMVPKEAIVALSTARPITENLELLQQRRFVRFPLVGERLEDFVGIVYVPALVGCLEALREEEMTLDEVATKPVTVDVDMPVSRLVDRLQEEEQEMALVVKGDDVVGLVTQTNAFEAILGDMRDPFDVE